MRSRHFKRKLENHLVICSDVYSVLNCFLFSKHCIYIEHPYEKHDEWEACDKLDELLSWASHVRGDKRLTKTDIKQWLIVALSLKGLCLYHGRIEKYEVNKDHVSLSLLGGYKVNLYSHNIVDNSILDKNVTRVYDYFDTRDLYLRGTHYLNSAVDRVYIHKRKMVAATNIPTKRINDFDYSSVAFRYDIRESLGTNDKFYLNLTKRETCFKIKNYEELKRKWHTQTSIIIPRAYINLSAAYRYKTTDFLLSSPLKNT